MKKVLYFIVGVLMLPVLACRKITEIGDIAVSNYIFWKRLDRNLKEEAKSRKA